MMNKVYFLLPDLSAGGAERVTISIARLLRKEGFDVEFVNIGFHSGEMLTWIEPEFKMTNLEYSRVLKAIFKLKMFMKLHSDGIYFSSREHVSIVGLLTAKMSNRQMVVRIPNMPRNNLSKGVAGFKLKVIKTINQWLLKSAKIVIAQNEEMREQLLNFYHLPNDKVVAINNPVDVDYVKNAADGSESPFNTTDINFLNVCNIAYTKGLDVLEAAWPKVKASIPNAHMYIVGRDTSEYSQKIVKESLSLKDFTFLGFKSNPYPYLKHCDVFVLPSRMEGFPNVVLEAQCFNRPVVSTTCVAVIKKIIQQGENGYYCDVEDADTLATCMIKAVNMKNIINNYNLFDKELLLKCFR